jgi:hypothetical protein
MKVISEKKLCRCVGNFFLFLILSCPELVAAQGTLNALVVAPGLALVGYTYQGVGWSFVPTADLSVTAVSSTAPQINFWLGTNQVIANYNFYGPYGGPPDFAVATNFQAVSTLLLFAGQTYFISTQEPNFSSEFQLFVYGLNPTGSPYDPPAFRTSSYITQFASYYLSSSNQWSPTTSPGYPNTDYAVLGPNFQFQVVPEPTVFKFLLLSAVVLYFRNRTLSTFSHGRKCR